jgi:hypothetical protein
VPLGHRIDVVAEQHRAMQGQKQRAILNEPKRPVELRVPGGGPAPGSDVTRSSAVTLAWLRTDRLGIVVLDGESTIARHALREDRISDRAGPDEFRYPLFVLAEAKVRSNARPRQNHNESIQNEVGSSRDAEKVRHLLCDAWL